MTSEHDPLADLIERLGACEPPEVGGELAGEDAATRRAVESLRGAWLRIEPPAATTSRTASSTAAARRAEPAPLRALSEGESASSVESWRGPLAAAAVLLALLGAAWWGARSGAASKGVNGELANGIAQAPPSIASASQDLGSASPESGSASPESGSASQNSGSASPGTAQDLRGGADAGDGAGPNELRTGDPGDTLVDAGSDGTPEATPGGRGDAGVGASLQAPPPPYGLGIEVSDVRADRIEMRSGSVRLVLLTADAPEGS